MFIYDSLTSRRRRKENGDGGGLRLARKWQVKYGTLDDSKPLRKEVPFSSKCDKNPLSGHSRTSFHQKFDWKLMIYLYWLKRLLSSTSNYVPFEKRWISLCWLNMFAGDFPMIPILTGEHHIKNGVPGNQRQEQIDGPMKWK